MQRSNKSIAVYLVLVFGSGAVVGALGHRLYSSQNVSAKGRMPNPSEYRRSYLEEAKTRLKLDEDQVKRIDAVLDATRGRYHAFRDSHKSEYQAIQEFQMREETAILRPDQLEAYKAWQEERKQRRRKHDGKTKDGSQ